MPFQTSRLEEARQQIRREKTVRVGALVPLPDTDALKERPMDVPVRIYTDTTPEQEAGVFASPLVIRRGTNSVFVSCPACDGYGTVPGPGPDEETCLLCNGDKRTTRARAMIWNEQQSHAEAAWDRSQP